jgi:hypothetical protein
VIDIIAIMWYSAHSLTKWRRDVMHAGLPMAGLPVSSKMKTRRTLQVGPSPESNLYYQVWEVRVSRAARNENAADISNTRLSDTSTYRRSFAADSLHMANARSAIPFVIV